LRTLAARANLGIYYAVPNQLEVTNPGGAANTLQIDTGAALVDGQHFYNDAAVTFTVPANRTNDLIVVRKNFTAATYTPPASVDADEQVPPYTARITRVTALVQSADRSTYWDIPLADFTTDGAGAVTINSDDREYLEVETKKLLLPGLMSYDFTGGANEAQIDLEGAPHNDGNLTYSFGHFLTPIDLVTGTDITIIPIVVSDSNTAAGNIQIQEHAARWGACNEDWNNHGGAGAASFTGVAAIAGTIAGAGLHECLTGAQITVATPSQGDYIHLSFQRNATADPPDTYTGDIFFSGFEIEYLGWTVPNA